MFELPTQYSHPRLHTSIHANRREHRGIRVRVEQAPNTQFDSVNGMRLTEERFYRQTKWPRDLSGQTVLEIGCGAGRFTEIALQTGAQVFSVDASHAIDVNYAHHGNRQNLVLCQASLYELPFRQGYFDKVFCFGVLQHTPDVSRAFAAISRSAKSGGELVVDAHNRRYWRNYHTPIYLIRPVTKRMSHDTCITACHGPCRVCYRSPAGCEITFPSSDVTSAACCRLPTTMDSFRRKPRVFSSRLIPIRSTRFHPR